MTREELKRLTPYKAYQYAATLKRPVPIIEPTMRRYYGLAVNYAVNIIGGRWPRYEKKLLCKEYGPAILDYVNRLIKGRWPAAEPILLEVKNHYEALTYCLHFIKKRWPELEANLLCEASQPHYRYTAELSGNLSSYVELVLDSRWPELEDLLLRRALKNSRVYKIYTTKIGDPAVLNYKSIEPERKIDV